jgi:hypothetical protein
LSQAFCLAFTVSSFSPWPRLHPAASAQDAFAWHVAIFTLFAGALALGVALYLFSRDSPD